MDVETTIGKPMPSSPKHKTPATRKRKRRPHRVKSAAQPPGTDGSESPGDRAPAPSGTKATQVDIGEVAGSSATADAGASAAATKQTAPAKKARVSRRTRADKSRATRQARAGSRAAQQTQRAVQPESDTAETGTRRVKKTSRTTKTPKRTKTVEADKTTRAAPSREMLINVSAGDECRIAVLHEKRLEELFIERESSQSHVGNIYKGRITNIEASIQAVFVDFGLPKNGFLHISDVQPQYFPDHKGEAEDVGRKIPRHSRPPIQKCFRRGQEVIVQITKEGVGTKGPTLTTYLSIPGRFLVMMPGMSKHGVSRRIEDEVERRKMRDMLGELDLPSGMGFIMRTAGSGRAKRDLKRDLQYLLRLWKTVVGRTKRLPAPAELYQESDLVTRTIRDVYTSDFSRIIVDDGATAKKAREFLRIAMPRSKTAIELYSEREPLFHRFGLEEEIEKINLRHVPLPSGGSIVIDTTEALVAIDVNSGRYRTPEDAEETALKINVEAAEEIARQLRLRDLGGLIVCDFIDMRLTRNKRKVYDTLQEAIKKHKERAKILKMTEFGIIEMTRQRQGPSLKRSIYFDCPHCKGSGQVKMPDSVVLDVMRIIQLSAHREEVRKVIVTVATSVAFQILNNKRAVLNEIETEAGMQLVVRGDPSFTLDQIDYVCEDGRGRAVTIIPPQSESPRS